MSHLFANGSFTLVQALEQGRRPEGPVIVALNGNPGWDNATVYADPMESYNWKWLRSIPSVVVVMGMQTRLGSILDDILKSGPGQLDVIDTDRELGWMVTFTKPKLRTIRWPQHTVKDWLGDGKWHADLNRIKAGFGLEVA